MGGLTRVLPLGLLVVAGCATGRPSPSKQLAAMPPEQAAHVRAMNAFALDLYPTLQGTNAVFSPASVYWALKLLEPGARGQSSSQLRALLGSSSSPSRVEGLRVANGLFGQPDFPFREEFLNANAGAELRSLDFAHDSKGAQKAINAWVSEQTNAKIPELLSGDTPSPDTRLVLVNALHFLATWAHPFAVEGTKDKPFTPEEGPVVQVPTMRHTSDWLYGESGPVRVVELTYRDTPIVMDLVLPKDPRGLKDVEAKLAHLDDWLGGLSTREVNLELPKFQMRATTPALVDRLKALGLTDVFDEQKADLSGIAGKPGDLVVSSVVHQAFLDVNEKGTEAAAATAVDVVLTGLNVNAPKPVDFHVDHPFLFVLRDSQTQMILFLGRVGRP